MQKIFLWIVVLFPIYGMAQTDSLKLKEITITSFRTNDSLLNTAASVGILSKKDLTANNHTDIRFAMNRIPGVLMQSSNLATTRISIRGIGARTSYGTNKIRAFYGNIPLTSGNSETVIDDIDLENISKIEVIRGPLSSIYGAGLGGAIIINPEKNIANQASISTTHGSFGLVKNTISASIKNKKSAFNISYHKLKTDGWRKNSAYNREGVTLSGQIFKTEKSSLNFLGNFTDLFVFIPSSIDRESFENNPKSAAANWANAKGYKNYKSVLGGLDFNVKISENTQNATSIFVNYKDNYEPRPFDILQQFTISYGIRNQLTGRFSEAINWNLGFEIFKDDYSGRNFENLYQQNNGNGSLQGLQIAGQYQNRAFANVFGSIKFQLTQKLELQTGLNFNYSQFDLDNYFEENSKQKFNYDGILAPQISVGYEPFPFSKIYASASRGFSHPSIDETLNADGTINQNIQPETGYNFEVGGKFYFFDKKLYAEIVGYHMQIQNLLVAQRIGDDQYVGVNAGETLHRGIEFSTQGFFEIFPEVELLPFASFSIGDYSFKEFLHNDNNFSGNQLTGVPSNKVNAGITIQLKSGFYILADYHFVDKIPLNDANTDFADAYNLFNAKAGFSFQIHHLKISLDAGINNVFDTKYASLILPNAVSNNNNPRYFYPGLPINYYGNISFSYNL